MDSYSGVKDGRRYIPGVGDGRKLDAVSVETAAPVALSGETRSEGISRQLARADHQHGLPADTTDLEAITGDVTIDENLVSSIGAGKVTNAQMTTAAKTRYAISDAVSLTFGGAGNTRKVIMMPARAITITKVRFIYETASNDGTRPNLMVGVHDSLESVVAAEAAEADKAQFYCKDPTIVSGAVAADKAVVFSAVAAGETTNTGAVRCAIEYTVDDPA